MGVAAIKGNAETSCQRLGSAAAQMIMTPGAHMIWMFSEMGNAQNTKTESGNDVSPKIVNWSLLDEPNHEGLYQSYCEMIAIRDSYKFMFQEDATFTMNCNQNNWTDGRMLSSIKGNAELYTLINPNYSGTLTMTVPFKSQDNESYTILSQSYNSSSTFDASAGTVTIPANCYVVIASKSVAAVDDVMADGSSEELRVIGGVGELIIDYAKNGAVIYTIDGSTVANVGTSATVSVSPGIYIVKSGKNSVKAIVK